MKTINKNIESLYEINKSKFYTIMVKIDDVNKVKDYIEEVKNKYKDASHYCYAYIIDDNMKSSDDGEPGGTAGIPIMEVLLKNDLNYVLCIVVRYFGGIKLGAGGLVRAYSKAVSSSLEDDNILLLVPGKTIEFTIKYEEQKSIDYILRDYKIYKEYGTDIYYNVDIPNDDLDKLNIEYKVLKDTYIKKRDTN